MKRDINAEFLWVQQAGEVQCVIRPLVASLRDNDLPTQAKAGSGNWFVPIQLGKTKGQVVYRCETTLSVTDRVAQAGPVYAILAGQGKQGGNGREGFVGGRLNFRDIMNLAKRSRELMYVVATDDVSTDSHWSGFVRLGHNHWKRIPCPRPMAIYNRIPTRALEQRISGRAARQSIQRLQIPMFNPEYFSKWRIYDVVRGASLSEFLPETAGALSKESLQQMLLSHDAVYLKPSGGSVGHGMIKIEVDKGGWLVSSLKHSKTTRDPCSSFEQVWRKVEERRVRGRYVIQQAVMLLEYKGRPCDFRVLLQKGNDEWHMVGRGVRVSGDGRITTHVPNGGSIADADDVLQQGFGERADTVNRRLEQFVLRGARAIDTAYGGELGEMSMDIGIDASGHPWFFEANAKPMKFDEPHIRRASLEGVLNGLRQRSRTL